jgi:hypothetical protein
MVQRGVSVLGDIDSRILLQLLTHAVGAGEDSPAGIER